MACVTVPAADALAATATDAVVGSTAADLAGAGIADAVGGGIADAAIGAGTAGLADAAGGALPWLSGAASGVGDAAGSMGALGDIFGAGTAANAATPASSLFSNAFLAGGDPTALTIGGMSGSAAAPAAASATSGASVLGTIAKLAPLVTTLMGGTKFPGTMSQSQIQNQKTSLQQNQQQLNQGFQTALNSGKNNGPLRNQTNPNTDYYTYGSRPQQSFYSPTTPIQFPNVQTSPIQSLAKGGTPKMNPNAGGTGGQDDNVQANLSKGEFVVPADVVSALGDGNTNGGANALKGMMHSVRLHKSSKGGKLPPQAKSPLQYMKIGGLPKPQPVRLSSKVHYVSAV